MHVLFIECEFEAVQNVYWFSVEKHKIILISKNIAKKKNRSMQHIQNRSTATTNIITKFMTGTKLTETCMSSSQSMLMFISEFFWLLLCKLESIKALSAHTQVDWVVCCTARTQTHVYTYENGNGFVFVN